MYVFTLNFKGMSTFFKVKSSFLVLGDLSEQYCQKVFECGCLCLLGLKAFSKVKFFHICTIMSLAILHVKFKISVRVKLLLAII
jgi:hypothetical protein